MSSKVSGAIRFRMGRKGGHFPTPVGEGMDGSGSESFQFTG